MSMLRTHSLLPKVKKDDERRLCQEVSMNHDSSNALAARRAERPDIEKQESAGVGKSKAGPVDGG